MKNFKEINRTFTVEKTKFLQRVLWLIIPLLTIFTTNAWGVDVVYKTAKFGSSYNSASISSYTSNWYSTYNGFRVDIANGNNNSNKWEYIKFGRSGTASVGTITTNAAIAPKVTKISITIDAITAAKINNITLSISSNGSSWTNIGTYSKSTGTQTVNIPAANQAANLYYKLTFDCASGSSNGLITISQVDYYADEANFDRYTLVTDASTLAVGDVIVFGASAYGRVAGVMSSNFLTAVSGTFNDGTLYTSGALEFTLSKSGNNWIFTNSSKQLRATSTSALSLATSGGYDTWSISISSNNATITSSYASYGTLQYNSDSPRFRNYTSSQKVIQIYRKGTSCSKKVALSGGSPSHGTVTFSPTGPVETCDAAQNVAMTITPTTGYKLTGWSTSGVSPSSTSPAVSTSGSTSETAQNITLTFAKEANGTYNASATFSQIMVSSLKLRAQQTGQTDKTGSDLTMTCYPKEGQTGGADPLNHTLNVTFYEVLPSNALTKTYTWSVRVKANGAANWTDVSFTGNTLNTNDIVNSFNKSTGALQIKSTEGTAEIKITANDGSGVTAKVTITVSNVALTGVSVLPTEMEVYAGQKKPVTVTFTPANATDRSYTTGSYTYVNIQNKAAASFNIEGKTTVTDANHNETVTVTTTDGSHTATINVTVKPLPKATFLDIVHSLTDFSTGGAALPSTGILIATVSTDGQTVTTTKKTPTHSDLSDPGSGNECERNHLHLAGWILKDWADEHPDATSSDISGAGAGNFYAPDADIDLVAKNGKTFYAVWAIIE